MLESKGTLAMISSEKVRKRESSMKRESHLTVGGDLSWPASALQLEWATSGCPTRVSLGTWRGVCPF